VIVIETQPSTAPHAVLSEATRESAWNRP